LTGQTSPDEFITSDPRYVSHRFFGKCRSEFLPPLTVVPRSPRYQWLWYGARRSVSQWVSAQVSPDKPPTCRNKASPPLLLVAPGGWKRDLRLVQSRPRQPSLTPEFRKMKTHFFKVVQTVAVQGSFSEAAAILGCSQSNISYAIKEVEAFFNKRLFIRSRTGCTLTPDGQVITRTLEMMLATLEQLKKMRSMVA
jgi:hypothetical protein